MAKAPSALSFAALIESQLFQEFTDFNSGKITKHRLNSPNMDTFYQWLVGFTDGDGTFSTARRGSEWSLTFQISQNSYNLRVLHYIKSQLNVGSVYSESNRSMTLRAHFRIRDLASLETTRRRSRRARASTSTSRSSAATAGATCSTTRATASAR